MGIVDYKNGQIQTWKTTLIFPSKKYVKVDNKVVVDSVD
jgi:hypothetical protein